MKNNLNSLKCTTCIMGQIINIDDLKAVREKYKSIALCSGCFDIIHSGHAVFFEQCKKFAETLVVGLGRDNIIQELKGDSRPINPEQNRLYLLAAMQHVDYVTLNGHNLLPGKIDFYDVMKELRPDVFVLNDDDSAIEEKREICGQFNVRLELVPRIVPAYLKPTSSSEILEKLI